MALRNNPDFQEVVKAIQELQAVGTYTLPIATPNTLGGIRVGTGLSIVPDTGVLSTTSTGGGGPSGFETIFDDYMNYSSYEYIIEIPDLKNYFQLAVYVTIDNHVAQDNLGLSIGQPSYGSYFYEVVGLEYHGQGEFLPLLQGSFGEYVNHFEANIFPDYERGLARMISTARCRGYRDLTFYEYRGTHMPDLSDTPFEPEERIYITTQVYNMPSHTHISVYGIKKV